MRCANFVWCCALAVGLAGPSVCPAQGIFIPNHDFSDRNNEGIATGGLLLPDYDTGFNNPAVPPDSEAPWRVRGDGIVQVLPLGGLLLSPTSTITSNFNDPLGNGRGYISGLAYVGVDIFNTSPLHNSAEIYNHNIGTNFVAGQQYLLTADFYTEHLISASALANRGLGVGLGVGLTANGVNVADSLTSDPSLVSLTLFDGNHGQLSFSYTASGLIDDQNIGIRLFAGEGSGLANIAALGYVGFDNVSLTAVPEPSGLAMAGCGLAGLGIVFYLRSRRLAPQQAAAAAAANPAAQPVSVPPQLAAAR